LERLDNIRQQDQREHLRYLAIAQARVFRCARGAGVTASAPEFRSFVHHLLATSTRCAEVGLGREALQLAMLGAMGWVKRPAPGMALPLGRAMVAGLRVAIVGSPR
jgi:hypothetical protein